LYLFAGFSALFVVERAIELHDLPAGVGTAVSAGLMLHTRLLALGADGQIGFI
jgi:hypothetical protein